MISKALLVKHLEYSLWASQLVLEAAAKLPADALDVNRGNSFGGILDTLVHIFRADRVWMRRLLGEPAAPFAPAGEQLTFADLREQWPEVMGKLIRHVDGLEEAAISGRLDWINIKGEPKNEVLYKILLHIVNHGTYHRGQVITMIKQAGGEVVSTDLVYYPGM
jgi:uncharacterized damage-inducible protein DinB